MRLYPLGHPTIHQHWRTRIPLQCPLTVSPPPKHHQLLPFQHKLTTRRRERLSALLLRARQPTSHPIKQIHLDLQSRQQQISPITPLLKQPAQVRLPQPHDYFQNSPHHRISNRFSPALRVVIVQKIEIYSIHLNCRGLTTRGQHFKKTRQDLEQILEVGQESHIFSPHSFGKHIQKCSRRGKCKMKKKIQYNFSWF